MTALDMNEVVGSHDIVWMTLDTLRFDVAASALDKGRLPTLEPLLGPGGWHERHTSGTFTYAAHHAFFAGYLPAPPGPPQPRLFASRFQGSETTADTTFVFDAPHVPGGLQAAGYRTICIGGVGFFNKETPLGRVFPDMFMESHWSPDLGVTDPRSTERQIALAVRRLGDIPPAQRVFLFINVSALHQPNCIFSPGAGHDSAATMEDALAYVDSQLSPLFRALQRRAPAFCMLTSDHGTAYGEDGAHGHRIAHPVVWTVPYAEFILPATSARGAAA